MNPETTIIIIERRESGCSTWQHFTNVDASGQPFDEQGAVSFAADRQFHNRNFHFRAVKFVTTREVLKRG